MSTELAQSANGRHSPQLSPTPSLPQAVEAALTEGNLAKLSVEHRIAYYNATCESVGVNALTRPFEYITLNGKLTLYATRSCTEQLRTNRKVSLTITAREKIGDVYVVTARATTPDGRTDESTGAVTLGKLTGDNLCNAMMKAETKAKRRVTLSICGLGWLDESETETIKGAVFGEQPAAPIAPSSPDIFGDEPAPGVHPAITDADIEDWNNSAGIENPWFHRIESERSPSRGKALYELSDAAWAKIHANPSKALMHFCEEDRMAILDAIANPNLKPE